MPSAQLRIGVLIDDGFDDDEFAAITEQFERTGARLKILAPFPGRLYSGRRGRLDVGCDIAVRGTRAAIFSALVIPGGYSPDRLRMRHAILDLVRDAIATNIPVGAVGHASQVLISANAVEGRTMTCWPSIAIDIKNAGGLYVDRPVVEDRGIVTARKIDDVPAFVEVILRLAAADRR
jgi:protease I